MKKLILPAMILVAAFVACKKTADRTTDKAAVDSSAVVKDETPADAARPMDSASMMKAWQAYATPGDVHKMLAADSGMWNETSTMWKGADDQKPTKSTMTADIKMIFGGRYQQAMHKGNFMGMPFEGVSTVAYNNASKKMESTWMDNMGTGIMTLTGDYDAASKKTEFKGHMTDPMTGKDKPVRETFTLIDDNTRKMEMFDVDAAGKEYKSMEIMMMRK